VVSAAVVLTAMVPGAAAGAPAPEAGGYVTIAGSGSSWQAVAIDRRADDVAPDGLTVNFNPDGSAAGRQDYMAGDQVDFAASDVAFRDGRDKLGRTRREVVPWGYSYVPAVAGGIAFVYRLSAHGHPVRDLRLSAQTLVEIFTGQITNWDNPRITRDNGRRLPNLRITPVVRADGAGVTFFFTSWLAREFPREWNAFCARVTHGRVTPPCGPTEFYPVSGPGWHPRAGSGANAVMSDLTSGRNNGAIGYIEYAYPLAAKATVARIANLAGRYVLPAPRNVTETLTRATVNENPRSAGYLQENLSAVYTSKNPLSYPLSYYGYLIVPRAGTRLPPDYSTAVGRSLSAFVLFELCGGQRAAAGLGYAALPRNLVGAGLQEVARIPGHVAIPALSRCESLPG
jgi:ABC-type phosphate transport system substrate-binding protein